MFDPRRLEAALIYDRGLAKALGSALAAIVLRRVMETMGPSSLRREDFGMGEGEFQNAIGILEAARCITQAAGGAWRINEEGVRALFGVRVKAATTEVATVIEEVEGVTFDRILAGDFDGLDRATLTQSEAMMQVLWSRHQALWGTDTPFLAENRYHWQAWLVAGLRPSDFAKALLGMRLDDWDKRPQHTGWRHLEKQHEKFISLFETDRRRRRASTKAAPKVETQEHEDAVPAAEVAALLKGVSRR